MHTTTCSGCKPIVVRVQSLLVRSANHYWFVVVTTTGLHPEQVVVALSTEGKGGGQVKQCPSEFMGKAR